MRYEVQMLYNGEWYPYGAWEDKNKANEVAMEVRKERWLPTQVVEKK